MCLKSLSEKTASLSKKSSVPYGAKLRKDMGFALSVRGTKISRNIGHNVI